MSLRVVHGLNKTKTLCLSSQLNLNATKREATSPRSSLLLPKRLSHSFTFLISFYICSCGVVVSFAYPDRRNYLFSISHSLRRSLHAQVGQNTSSINIILIYVYSYRSVYPYNGYQHRRSRVSSRFVSHRVKSLSSSVPLTSLSTALFFFFWNRFFFVCLE